MVSKGERIVVLYPEYFDASLSRKDGRRVPKRLAIQGPKVEDIEKAARNLKLNPVKEESAYPRFWWKARGRVICRKAYPKSQIINWVGKRLKMKRSGKPVKK